DHADPLARFDLALSGFTGAELFRHIGEALVVIKALVVLPATAGVHHVFVIACALVLGGGRVDFLGGIDALATAAGFDASAEIREGLIKEPVRETGDEVRPVV